MVPSSYFIRTPTAEAEANLGVIEENMVNILLHGHDPSFFEMVVLAAEDPELIQMAKDAGAEGINLVGMCCTGNKVTMRHGVRIAGNFYQQELAVITGAIEAVIVDVQCIFPALAKLADCYHTSLSAHLLKQKWMAVFILNLMKSMHWKPRKNRQRSYRKHKNRDRSKVYIPQEKNKAVVGYSVETIIQHLDKVVNSHVDEFNTVKPLADVIWAVIRGAAGVVVCNNPS